MEAMDVTQDSGMSMMMMMPMYFWKGNSLTWLFYNATSSNGTQYFGGLILVFLFGIALEAVYYLRNYIYIKAQILAIKKTEELNR